MEDGMIKYDNTVRGSNNGILQFVYGDSGVNAVKMSQHYSTLFKLNNKEVEAKYKFSSSDLKKFKGMSEKANNEYYNKILNLRDEYRKAMINVNQEYINVPNRFALPVNLNRIIDTYTDYDTDKNEKLEPEYVVRHLEKLMDYKFTQVNTMTEAESVDKKSNKYDDEIACKSLFQYAINEWLAPKRCIDEYKFNKEQFDRVFHDIVTSFNKSIVEPGEMVGIIGAQSIGEPVTHLGYEKVLASIIDALMEDKQLDTSGFKSICQYLVIFL